MMGSNRVKFDSYIVISNLDYFRRGQIHCKIVLLVIMSIININCEDITANFP